MDLVDAVIAHMRGQLGPEEFEQRRRDAQVCRPMQTDPDQALRELVMQQLAPNPPYGREDFGQRLAKGFPALPAWLRSAVEDFEAEVTRGRIKLKHPTKGDLTAEATSGAGVRATIHGLSLHDTIYPGLTFQIPRQRGRQPHETNRVKRLIEEQRALGKWPGERSDAEWAREFKAATRTYDRAKAAAKNGG